MSVRFWAAAGISIAVVLIFLLWLRNYRREGSAPEATSNTTGTVFGLVSGVVMSFAIFISMFFGALGDVAAAWPAEMAQISLGVLAFLGFSDFVEVGVVTGTVLVIVIILLYAAVRD